MSSRPIHLWLYEPVRELYTCCEENASTEFHGVERLFDQDRIRDGIARQAGLWYLLVPFG